MAQKLPDIVVKLQQLAKPTWVNGFWRKPAINSRRLAKIRRELVSQGVYWPPKPLRDRSKDKPFKLSKHERNKESRQQMIEENMRKMPEMIEEHRNKVYELRRKTREKKQQSEMQKYLIATGKATQQGPHWEMFKDERKKKP